MSITRSVLGSILPVMGLLAAATAHARQYEVTITNITKGQTFTPQLIATHDGSVSLFELGAPASAGLELLAEAGDTSGAAGELTAQGSHVGDVQTIPAPLEPGHSVSMRLTGRPFQHYFTLAAMLIPTNDTFVSLNRVRLPRWGRRVYTALAYDAGSEANDQNCAHIPGPRCGGEGFSPGPNEGDEGYVYVSNGFHDLEDSEEAEVLGPFVYDWRNPVARIVIKRVK
jgi:hypothetical protein